MTTENDVNMPIAQTYAPDLYPQLPDEPARDNFNDFVNELEHYMIQLRDLFPNNEPQLNDLISAIWENTRDLTGPDAR